MSATTLRYSIDELEVMLLSEEPAVNTDALLYRIKGTAPL
jgi:hypothetical protein